MGGKGMGTSAKGYGKKRERDFMKFLTSNKTKYKPLSDEQVQDRYSEYQASRGLSVDMPYINYEDLSPLEKIDRNYGDKIELAKRKTAMGIFTANQQRKAIIEAGEQAIKDREKHAEALKNAAFYTSNNIVNSVNNSTQNVMSSGRAGMDYGMKEYNRLIVPGEVDGD